MCLIINADGYNPPKNTAFLALETVVKKLKSLSQLVFCFVLLCSFFVTYDRLLVNFNKQTSLR